MSVFKGKILVVDDEPDIRELIEYNLKKEGYQVVTAENGKEAIEQAKIHSPQLILLDIMMPEMDGIEACRNIRSLPDFKNTFIVFLTARSEEYSEVSGFNVGADDYITKPIKPRILMSRISALLRRNKIEEEREDKLEISDLIIDREAFLVFRGQERIVIVTNRTIDVHVRKIREKLGNGYVGTVKGVGYKFESQES